MKLSWNIVCCLSGLVVLGSLTACATSFESAAIGHERTWTARMLPPADKDGQTVAVWGHAALSASTSQLYLTAVAENSSVLPNGISDVHLDAGATCLGVIPVTDSVYANAWLTGAAWGGYTAVDRSLYDFDGWAWGAMAQAGGRLVLGRRVDPVNFFLEGDLYYAFERGEWYDERRRIDGQQVDSELGWEGVAGRARNASLHGHSLGLASALGLHLDAQDGNVVIFRTGAGFTVTDVWDFMTMGEHTGMEMPLFAGVGYQLKDGPLFWLESTTTLGVTYLLTGLEPRTYLKAGVAFRLD